MIRPGFVWLLAALALAGYVVTLNRVPIEFGDGPFYASIARSLQLGRAGVPSLLKQGPTSVDHLRFYGPVYFSTLAAWFTIAGCSSLAFRIFCFASALLAAAGAVAVSWSLGGGRTRQAWAMLLVLLSPELGFAATFGRMDPLAVGLEMFALAVFVHGVTFERRPWLHGAASGAVLAAAALSTPRTFPFVLGFAIALVTVLPRGTDRGRRHAWRQALVCVATAAALWLAWTIVSSGGPRAWFRMMAYIATHEDTDVALLRAHRTWLFVWWQAVTPGFAIVGAALVAQRLRGRASYTVAASFALATTWIALVATWTLFEDTFLFESLAILPLFSVVLAIPVVSSDRSRARMAVVGAALVCFFVGVRVAKQVRAVVTWSGRDPAPLTAFVKTHVPAGSEVLGPDEDYFFAVEESGSRYLIATQRSASDWARWMAAIDGTPAAAPNPVLADYLLWPRDLPPPALSCLAATARASYDPPPMDFPRLSRLVRDDPRAQYAATTLYALTPTCANGRVD